MVRVESLDVNVDDKQILYGIDLTIKAGTVHAIMGPNGSGKSTFAHTLIGDPQCIVTRGSICLNDLDITTLSPDKRAQAGIFLAFQQPPAIPGVDVFTFLKETYQACIRKIMPSDEFRRLVEGYMSQLRMNEGLLFRQMYDGFSGGEKKQLEMLQLLLLKPKLAILDEIDSGLDVDALKNVASALLQARSENPTISIVIITHYQRVLEYVIPDYVHILCAGKVVKSGSYALVKAVEDKGYDAYLVQ